MTTARVTFYAGAAEAAGTDSTRITLPDGATVGDLISALGEGKPRLTEVLGVCAIAVAGQQASDGDEPLPAGEIDVDVLPPFAGG